jgi:hypothetical protein
MLASLLLALMAFAPAASAAPPAAGVAIPVPASAVTVVGGTLTNVTFTLDRVISQGGQLVAVGTLTGTLTNATTGVVSQISQVLQIPLTASGSCQILHLTLGPLDLDLLGLQVHLDRVVLDITAQSGPGNLLGNLLCAVAHLLDNNGPLNGLTGLLNRILGLLTL